MISLLFFLSVLFFQVYETFPFRYSRIGFGGSARYSAMAGAFGALGGDASVLSTNPAGLAFFRKNEFSLTPSLFSQNVTSTYNGTTTEDSRYNLRFDNFGLIFAGRTDNTSEVGWQTIGFGIAYNRYSSFQANLLMMGESNTSMMDSWALSASGSTTGELDQFNEGLAWDTYLLNYAPGNTTGTEYVDTIPDGDRLRQMKQIEMRGGMGEWVFSLAGNYSEKFFIGASLGIPQVRYEEIARYSEEEVYDTVSAFNSYAFTQSLETRGRGVNFKLGMIYRPIDLIRVGFAFHSPSFLKLSDAYSSEMSSNIGGVIRQSESDQGSFNYSLRTPMRLMGSLAVIFGKTGVLSMDYELTDYSEAKLRASDYAFLDANNAIRSKYTMGHNVRVGGEVRVAPFAFRAGFGWYGSPYNSSVPNDAARMYYTAGAGYRSADEVFFIDLGVVVANEKSNYYFYDQSLVSPVKNVWSSVNTVLTLGFRY
jgi:long-subunit fatty acid transport protein